MASTDAVKVLEVFHISPSGNANELSLPLTHYDTPFINSLPNQRVSLYEFPGLSPAHFLDSVIPSLKNSLSVTLSHFLPLAGSLTWPPESQKPIIRYTPGDSVYFTVAEFSDSTSFDRLSSNDALPAIGAFPLLPKLVTSDSRASIIALQVTVFQSRGFCIAFVCHHAVLDAHSGDLFLKAWSYFCRNSHGCKDFTTLPPEVTPSFNRDDIKNPSATDKESFGQLLETGPQTLKIQDDVEYPENLVRATFTLTKTDIDNLKNRVITWQQREGIEALHLSTFVVTCSYVLICLLKAYKPQGKKGFYLSFGSNMRSRQKPPLPKNYFGNCLGVGGIAKIEDRDLTEEDGIGTLAEKISDEIREIDDRSSKDGQWWLSKLAPLFDAGNHVINVAGLPRFEVYEIDYGWGKPKKVEIVSINRDGGFALNQNRDANGGVDVSLVLSKEDMEIFQSLFHVGLKMLSQS